MFPTWRRGVRFLFVFLALAINVAFGTASAIDRPHRLAELQHIALTSRDGAPADAAAIAQTKDGYLWVGAASGLYRFDGINFERMTSLGGQSIADQPVIKLFTDREDGLWIGFGGYGAGYFKEGRYRAFGRDVGIRVMSEGLADMDGVVWLVVNGRLARFIDGAIKPLGDEWNFPSGRIVDMRLGATGTLWVGVNSDAATPYLPRGGTKFQRAPPQFHAANLGIARDGTIWGASDGRLQMLTLRDGIPDEVVSISKEAFGIMTFDRSGGLWIEGSRGLMHVADPAKLRSPPQAWRAGPETVALRAQLEAMPDGGTFAITIPEAPYRCPPGPYERACQVASYFKQAKPRSRVLILDENPDVVSKAALFKRVWSESYPGIVEYRPRHRTVAVDGTARVIRFEIQEDVRADVLNVLPPMRAARIAVDTGLANSNGRWCNVDYRTFESTAARHVHVIGDAVQGAAMMPKSGHMANAQAKVVAAAIVAELRDVEVDPAPMLTNVCYSFVDATRAMHVASVHAYVDAAKTYVPVAGSGGVSSGPSALEGLYARNWAETIWADTVGSVGKT